MRPDHLHTPSLSVFLNTVHSRDKWSSQGDVMTDMRTSSFFHTRCDVLASLHVHLPRNGRMIDAETSCVDVKPSVCSHQTVVYDYVQMEEGRPGP